MTAVDGALRPEPPAAIPGYVPRAAARHRGRSSLLTLHWVMGLPLFIAAFVNLPRELMFGPISAMGLLTIVEAGIATLGLLACRHYPRALLVRLVPYAIFLFVVGLTWLWAPLPFEGTQNGIVYLLFGLGVAFAGTLAARDPRGTQRLVEMGIGWINWVALAIVLRDVVLHGLPSKEENYLNAPGDWLVGPRSVALVGLLPVSWYLARWYGGRRRSALAVILWIAAMILSLSRTATAAAVLLIGGVIALQLRFHPTRLTTTLPVLAAVVTVVTGLVLYSDPFRDRVFSGDTSIRVGEVGVNASGRMAFWTVTVASAMESPWVGKGLGSSQEAVGDAFEGAIVHPHNDYLRIWHDVGFIGAVPFVAALLGWCVLFLRAVIRTERRGRRASQLELAAALVLVALLLVMLTDNAIIYPYVMGPYGILVGAALGARAYEANERRR